jgi:hypothetical protein
VAFGTVIDASYNGLDVRFVGSWMEAFSSESEHLVTCLARSVEYRGTIV